MTRIPFALMRQTFKQSFLNAEIPEEKAEICARIYIESSCGGVYSHELNRIGRFVDYISRGWVDIDAEPSIEKNIWNIETYNEKLGPGILNARFFGYRIA